MRLEIYQIATRLKDESHIQHEHEEGVAVGNKWIGPKAPFVKANWDAALKTTTNSMGMGGIIRDPQGNALVTMYSTIKSLPTPFLAEALTLRKFMLVC